MEEQVRLDRPHQDAMKEEQQQEDLTCWLVSHWTYVEVEGQQPQLQLDAPVVERPLGLVQQVFVVRYMGSEGYQPCQKHAGVWLRWCEKHPP